MKSLFLLGLILVGAYLALCALYYLQQDKLLFIGAGPIVPPPSPRIERVEHLVDDLALRGVRVLPQAGRTVLLYFGGNAEPVVANAYDMLRLGSVTAYLIDYRGYGESEGSPSETDLRKDALAHFDWIRDRHPANPIVVVGRSLGTAMALHVAARREIDGLVLISPFTSLRDVARFHLPWLPVGPFMRHPFDTVPDARRIRIDPLVIAAEHDSVIPRYLTEALVRELPSRPEAHFVPRTDHNDLMATQSPWDLVRDYLEGR